jgi:hypothetical protein
MPERWKPHEAQARARRFYRLRVCLAIVPERIEAGDRHQGRGHVNREPGGTV